MSPAQRDELTQSRKYFNEYFEGIPTSAIIFQSNYDNLMDFRLMNKATMLPDGEVSNGKMPVFVKHPSRDKLFLYFHKYTQTPAHDATRDHDPIRLVKYFPYMSEHRERFEIYNEDRIVALKDTYKYLIYTNFPTMFGNKLTRELHEITALEDHEFMEATRTFHEKLKKIPEEYFDRLSEELFE